MSTQTGNQKISGDQPAQDSNERTASGMGKSQAAAPTTSTNQNSLENFKVAVRLRPFTERERQRQNKRIVDIEHNTVALYNPRGPDEAAKRFTFDHSYWSHDGFKRRADGVNVPDPEHPNCDKYVDQEQVFEDLGRFLLENALEGYNSALLAYGQTGSGKSYTVSGYGRNEGILSRFARELFAELDRRLPSASSEDQTPASSAELDESDTTKESEVSTSSAATGSGPKSTARFEVYFSMIEIYNEVVRDLLAQQNASRKGPASGPASIARRGLRVREHPKRGFFVESLSSYPCSSKDEIESLIEEGQLNKSIAATSMNETSSRGHTIYEFHIKQFRRRQSQAAAASSHTPPSNPRASPSTTKLKPGAAVLPVETTTISSVVQLVDLAGSERMTIYPASGSSNSERLAARPGSRSSSPFGSPSEQPANGSSSIGRSRSVRNPTSAAADSSGTNTTTTTTTSNAKRSQNQPASSASSSSSAGVQQLSGAGAGKRSANQPSSGNLLSPGMSSQHQQRFRESVSINQSLSALGNCIQVLSQFSQQQTTSDSSGASATKQPKIPYRDSVLTKLLNRCCLGGNSKVVLIATLSPADANYDDTLSTLRFADRAKQIRTHAVINRTVEGAGTDAGVSALQRENERLKQILDGRVTRSDDSSQTSNFDDSENMQDNFQGPKMPGSPGRKPRKERASTVTRTRATGSRSSSNSRQQVATGGTNGRRQAKTSGQVAQESQTSKRTTPAGPPSEAARIGNTERGPETAPASRGFRSRSQTIAAPAGSKLLQISSASLMAGGAATPTDGGDQMEQLVSSAEKKRRQKRRALSRMDLASISLDDETEEDEEAAGNGDYQDDDDYRDEADRDDGERARDAGAMGGGARTQPAKRPGQTMAADGADVSTLQLGSEMLDEIDLNELANIIDDENLLSPDSDDSFNQSVARARLDENMSKQEKASILNKLLSNSNVANRIIKRQIEGSIKQVKQDRPKEAGVSGKQHLRPVKRGELIGPAGASSAPGRPHPCLSNLNPDEQLSSLITYMIEVGETIVGKEDSCDLLIYGPGLRGRHAKITRTKAAGEQSPPGECFIEPLFDPGPEPKDKQSGEEGESGEQLAHGSRASQARRVALLLNGEPVLARVRLRHGDRLLFGSAGYFVFLDEASASKDNQWPPEPVTYDMAHAEVMRKMMSETENEAMIREIKDYTHRPGTGRRDRSRDSESGGAAGASPGEPGALVAAAPADLQGKSPPGGAGAAAASDNQQGEQEREIRSQLDEIKEEEGEHPASGREPAADDPDELYRERLMADTYEMAMPIAEANAIANEMSIRVTYGLKILTGGEQLEPLMGADEQWPGGSFAADEQTTASGSMEQNSDNNKNSDTSASINSNVIISSEQPIKPETLDIPPQLYVHVRLDELELDFYWTKEKFQERRVNMLELYGAWDVGGKSGLVEYLIEQSKYQGYYMIDPFVDDLRSTWVLVGHAQVSLKPLSHAAPLSGRFDVVDVNDETVGSLLIEAVPCESELASDLDGDEAAEWPYRRRDESANVLEEARELLDKKFVFLLRIASCSRLVTRSRFAQVFCQYTLNRDQPTIRTRLISGSMGAQRGPDASGTSAESGHGVQQQGDHAASDNELPFELRHFVVVERVTQDILNFLQHGFLTIQLVGQYESEPAAHVNTSSSSAGSSVANSAAMSGRSKQSAGSSASRSAAQPTLVSAIISSINKYRYRMEQQSAVLQNLQFQRSGEYANSLGTYSAGTYRVASSSTMHSNSGPGSVTSASNMFDGQPDDDEAVGMGVNGASNQENIIDMILTKRKLDRAENQLHYIKRTINIAEHHNKKHIPVRTVKKLLNSYGQELEGGGLEEMAAEVTAETKTSENKHSNCSIQ